MTLDETIDEGDFWLEWYDSEFSLEGRGDWITRSKSEGYKDKKERLNRPVNFVTKPIGGCRDRRRQEEPGLNRVHQEEL